MENNIVYTKLFFEFKTKAEAENALSKFHPDWSVVESTPNGKHHWFQSMPNHPEVDALLNNPRVTKYAMRPEHLNLENYDEEGNYLK